MDHDLEWLKQTTEAAGISGFEQPVKELLVKKLEGFAEMSYDKLGSVIFKKNGVYPNHKIIGMKSAFW